MKLKLNTALKFDEVEVAKLYCTLCLNTGCELASQEAISKDLSFGVPFEVTKDGEILTLMPFEIKNMEKDDLDFSTNSCKTFEIPKTTLDKWAPAGLAWLDSALEKISVREFASTGSGHYRAVIPVANLAPEYIIPSFIDDLAIDIAVMGKIETVAEIPITVDEIHCESVPD